MIWFACPQCGKTHSRPESAAGATIFCGCGAGTMVPWESTVAEPVADAPAADVVPALTLAPVTFAPPPRSATGPPRARKRGRLAQRDTRFCLNHEDIARQAACADCGESFCDGCLVCLGDAVLCGPCKNYRVKNLQRASRPSNLSIVSMLLALLSAPVALALLPSGRTGFPWWSLLAVVPQAIAVALALRDAGKDPNTPGRSLAYTGIVSAAVTTALIVLLTFYSPHRWT
jgi:hypothetical protein